MGFGKLGSRGGFGSFGGLGTVGASAFGNGPAPAGYQWQFVTENSARVTELGQPVVTLVKVS